jgi:hypothetical protein
VSAAFYKMVQDGMILLLFGFIFWVLFSRKER